MTLNPKEVVIAGVFLIFILPPLLGALSYVNNPSEEELPQVVEDLAVPWWIGIMLGIVDTFEKHPYVLIVVFLAFVAFLKWIGEIK